MRRTDNIFYGKIKAQSTLVCSPSPKSSLYVNLNILRTNGEACNKSTYIKNNFVHALSICLSVFYMLTFVSLLSPLHVLISLDDDVFQFVWVP